MCRDRIFLKPRISLTDHLKSLAMARNQTRSINGQTTTIQTFASRVHCFKGKSPRWTRTRGRTSKAFERRLVTVTPTNSLSSQPLIQRPLSLLQFCQPHSRRSLPKAISRSSRAYSAEGGQRRTRRMEEFSHGENATGVLCLPFCLFEEPLKLCFLLRVQEANDLLFPEVSSPPLEQKLHLV